jgi:hypothetical protein
MRVRFSRLHFYEAEDTRSIPSHVFAERLTSDNVASRLIGAL